MHAQCSFESEQETRGGEEPKTEEDKPQPLSQLITTLSRQATTELTGSQQDDLFINYANIMSQVIRVNLMYDMVTYKLSYCVIWYRKVISKYDMLTQKSS